MRPHRAFGAGCCGTLVSRSHPAPHAPRERPRPFLFPHVSLGPLGTGHPGPLTGGVLVCLLSGVAISRALMWPLAKRVTFVTLHSTTFRGDAKLNHGNPFKSSEMTSLLRVDFSHC